MKPEVIDLDGGDNSPDRAGAVRAVGVALAIGTLLGWAAMSSTAFRGPFATPYPSPILHGAAVQPTYTPAPTAAIDNAAKVFTIRCVVPGEVFSTTVMVNGQPVRFSVPLAQSSSLACASPAPLPFDRFAR